MSISLEEVQHVARLARLELDHDELLAFQQELSAVLGHFEQLEEIELADIEGQHHAVAMVNNWAADIPGECLTRAEAVRNAPATRAGLFLVPTIIED